MLLFLRFCLILTLFVLPVFPAYGQELVPIVLTATPAPRPATMGATVRGRVLYSDTSRPVRFAGLNLVPERTRGGNGNGSGIAIDGGFVASGTISNGKTDENGEFVIKNVQPGTYHVSMTAAGFLTKSSFGNPRTLDPQVESEFFETFEVAGPGEIQVLVRAVRAGSISGRITYADGEVAAGLTVEALRKTDRGFSPSSVYYGPGFTTDDRGNYRIIGLAAGEYIVRVVEPFRHNSEPPQYYYGRPEYSALRTYYPEGDRSDGAKVLNVALGEDVPGIDVSIPERQLFSISGRVVSKVTRKPLEGFTVRFVRIDQADRQVRESSPISSDALSNVSGEWGLQKLPPGKYAILVSERQRYTSDDKDTDTARYGNARKEVEITDKDLESVEIEVAGESSVIAIVTDEEGKPMPEASGILLTSEDGRRVAFPEIRYGPPPPPGRSVDPTVRFGKVEPGKYRVSSASQRFFVSSATLNGTNVLSETFEVKEGETVKGLAIVISTAMGTIKGRVENFDQSLRSYGVQVLKPGTRFEPVSGGYSALGPNGEFSVRVAPGSYRIVMIPPPQMFPRDQEGSRRFLEELMQSARQVTVAANQSIEITLQKP